MVKINLHDKRSLANFIILNGSFINVYIFREKWVGNDQSTV